MTRRSGARSTSRSRSTAPSSRRSRPTSRSVTTSPLPNLVFLASVLALQSQQLTATELSLGATAAMARRTFTGAELGVAHRPSGESRVALALAGGTSAARPAARAQLTLQLLVNPAARSGPGLYAGVGGAFAARRGSPGQGFLVVLLGLEAAPGGREGWDVELGVAGGVGAAAGGRVRWFPRGGGAQEQRKTAPEMGASLPKATSAAR